MIRRQSASLMIAVKADQRQKYAPRIGQSVTVIGQDKVILILFVLSSEDVSLMSGIGSSFWTLSIMLGNNA
jgi:hypothetical protein